MADQRRENAIPTGLQVGGGMVRGVEKFVDEAGKLMLRDAPKVGRFIARKIPGAPGLVMDIAEYSTSDNRARTRAEIIGGIAGGALGSFGGPLGAGVGAVAGQMAGEYAYDLYDKHRDDLRRGAGDMAKWLKMREAQIAGDALNGLQRYTRPTQLRERF